MTRSEASAPSFQPLEAEVLTAEAFAPFGAVVAHGGATGRWFVPSAFEPAGHAVPAMWVNRLVRVEHDVVLVDRMERHPFTAQTCVPLGTGRLMIVVAPPTEDGGPDFGGLRAFVVEDTGVTYRAGVWHHGSLALDRTMEAVFVMGWTGRGNDTELRAPGQPIQIRVPPRQPHVRL